MTPLGLDHLALHCSDPAGTARFYGELLGLPVALKLSGVSEEWGGRAWSLTGYALPDGSELDFFAVAGHAPARLEGWRATVNHFALRIDSLDKWRARLAEFGVAIAEEQDHGDHDSVYVFDPNGHYLELVCPKR
jgi:catechol 2,3-dioxygenase-like lactoylglutathione lyase family enzyme